VADGGDQPDAPPYRSGVAVTDADGHVLEHIGRFGKTKDWPERSQCPAGVLRENGTMPSSRDDDLATIETRTWRSVYSGFSQSALLIGCVQKTPPSVMVWLPPTSVARISNS
jgi:hypothetical protein